jgi:hypothetical protein
MTSNIQSCNALFTIIIEQMAANQATNLEPDIKGYKELAELIVKLDVILNAMMPSEMRALN